MALQAFPSALPACSEITFHVPGSSGFYSSVKRALLHSHHRIIVGTRPVASGNLQNRRDTVVDGAVRVTQKTPLGSVCWARDNTNTLAIQVGSWRIWNRACATRTETTARPAETENEFTLASSEPLDESVGNMEHIQICTLRRELWVDTHRAAVHRAKS